MTPEEQASTAAGLRQLADLVESSPNVPLPEDGVHLSVSANVWDWTGDGYGIDPVQSLAKVRRLARGLGRGRKEKVYNKGGFQVRKNFGDRVSLTVTASRDAVCRAVPTGKVITHPPYTSPGWEEQEVKWICDETLLDARRKP